MNTKSYNKKINEALGLEEAKLLKEDLLLYGSYRKLPDEFDKNIVITHLNLKWNPETRSYRSEGEIGIANIGKTQINKLVEGNLEIIKRRSGDIFHLYLKINKYSWYFFSYTRGVLQCLASNDTFNTIIKETKPKHRKYKGASSSQPYIYILSTDNKYKKTIERFSGEIAPGEEQIDDEEDLQYFD